MIIRKIFIKKAFMEINKTNDIILHSERWEDTGLSYEARPPFIWSNIVDKLKLTREYFECVNKSYAAGAKIQKLKKDFLGSLNKNN